VLGALLAIGSTFVVAAVIAMTFGVISPSFARWSRFRLAASALMGVAVGAIASLTALHPQRESIGAWIWLVAMPLALVGTTFNARLAREVVLNCLLGVSALWWARSLLDSFVLPSASDGHGLAGIATVAVAAVIYATPCLFVLALRNTLRRRRGRREP